MGRKRIETILDSINAVPDQTPLSVTARPPVEAAPEPTAAEILTDVAAASSAKLNPAPDEIQAAPVKRKYKKREPKVVKPESDTSVDTAALAPILQNAVGIPFQIVATSYDCPGIALSIEESTAIAASLDAVMKAYLPQVTGKQAVLGMFLFSIASVSLSKYYIYCEHSKNPAKQN